MNIPKDPAILLSFVNTKLRDNYTSFDALVNAFEYYNCNNEQGTYSAFYMEVKEG